MGNQLRFPEYKIFFLTPKNGFIAVCDLWFYNGTIWKFGYNYCIRKQPSYTDTLLNVLLEWINF